MVARARRVVALPAEVVSDPNILGGMPVVRGTRIPAETIIAYVRDGYTVQEIFEDFPSLPPDGIEACLRWARARDIPMMG